MWALKGGGDETVAAQHQRSAHASVSVHFPRPSVSNDFGFEGVFARQVEALGREGDVLVGLSTSGNVVRADAHAIPQPVEVEHRGRGAASRYEAWLAANCLSSSAAAARGSPPA